MGRHLTGLPALGRTGTPQRARTLIRVQLRASELLGTDLVALAIWPEDHDSLAGDGVVGMPVEARCVDLALAAALEDVVQRTDSDSDTCRPEQDTQERAARGLLRWLVTRAQRHQQG